MNENKTFYQQKVSAEAYEAHQQRMQQRSKDKTKAKNEARGGDEGNISDTDIPEDIRAQRNKKSDKSN
jgi:hypothetical protein